MVEEVKTSSDIRIPSTKPRELYKSLIISQDGSTLTRLRSGDKKVKSSLPEYPRISLQSPEVAKFLTEELTTPDLNKFHPHLWKVGTQCSSHVTPLSEQAVRGRTIIITENPEFHLLWIGDRVYIKPIPKFLLSHAFWEFYFTSKNSPLNEAEKEEIAKAARGFLRSYEYLIRHKSDFILAQKAELISKKLKYTEFVSFITTFSDVLDSEVSLRYEYGELRLGRLNLWAFWALNRFEFHKIVRHHGDFFAKWFGPILFLFGAFSVVLSAMQVALAGAQTPNAGSWASFTDVCKVFSILTLAVVIFVVFCLILFFVIRLVSEIVFALKARFRKRRDNGGTH